MLYLLINKGKKAMKLKVQTFPSDLVLHTSTYAELCPKQGFVSVHKEIAQGHLTFRQSPAAQEQESPPRPTLEFNLGLVSRRCLNSILTPTMQTQIYLNVWPDQI